jgi:competence protein ComEC
VTIHRLLRLAAVFWVGLAATIGSKESHAQWTLGRSSDRQVVVTVLDIGQGDSILIRSPEGKTALIDAGPTKGGAVALLKREGIKSLDLVALSHHHSDHYSGMDEVVRTMKPRYFLVSKSGHATTLYLKLLKTVELERVTVIQPTEQARKIELGTVELTIFPQPPEDRRDENNNSIGLRLTYGAFSMLLTGDSEAPERRWWLAEHPELVRNCTILKVPHHGSRNGTDARWLKEVAPALAVASLGRDNEFGHPHSETVNLLRRSGVPFLRTDQLGSITITSNGRDWKVSEPALTRNGHPTQADVDRVADATSGDAVGGSRARARVR